MCRLVLVFGASASLLAFGVGMQAQPQDKKPEAPAAAPVGQAAPAAQDRLDFGPVLDTWYKIEALKAKEPEHIGFSREVLMRQPAGTPWRYSYTSETEIDQLIPDPKEKGKETAATKKVASSESSIIRDTRLDDTFAPSALVQVDDRNGSAVTSTVSLVEGQRKIRVSVTPAEHKDHSVNPDEEIYYSRFLMFLALRQNDSLSKQGQRKAMLFVPKEDGTSVTAEVLFQIGEMIKREYLGKKEVSVTPIVYIKPPPAATRDAELLEAYVDRYGRVVEEVSRAGNRKLIVKDHTEAIPKSLMVRQSGRRDPFDKRGPLGAAGRRDDAEGGPRPGQKIDQNNNMVKLGEAKKLVADLKKAKEESREAEGEKIYEDLISYYTGFKKFHDENPLPPDVLAQVEAFRSQAEEIWGGEARLESRLRTIYARSLEAFKRDNCEQLDAGITELKKYEGNNIITGRAGQKLLNEWIADLVPKSNQCKTRIELAKKRIVLSGTTLAEEPILVPMEVTLHVFGVQVGTTQPIRFIKPVRLAVINDKSYRIGDLVEGEGVRVEKIWAHGVQVSLKDETREVGIRQ